MNSNEFIDEHEAARCAGKAVATMRNWRSKALRYGPPFYKIGASVRYKRSDIDAWLEKQMIDPSVMDKNR